jgi:uncharacterized protein YutE (UPF0331/DUF86 family)
VTNPTIINERLNEIDENVAFLEEMKNTSFDNFSKDKKIHKLARYCLQLAIQSILDICHHIIVDNNWTKPETHSEAIAILAQRGIFPHDFAERIAPLAGLRNLLIHEYLKIDLKLLYGHLQHLQDFREFQKYIIAYLKSL